jgi:hypothetical protein
MSSVCFKKKLNETKRTHRIKVVAARSACLREEWIIRNFTVGLF